MSAMLFRDRYRCVRGLLFVMTLSWLMAGTSDARPGDLSSRVVTPYAVRNDTNAVALGDSGRILIAGATDTTPADILISSYVPRGFPDTLQPDLSFGDNGKVILDLGGDDVATAIVTDGFFFYVAGYTDAHSDSRVFFVARFFDGGTLDRSYGHEGWTQIGFGDDVDQATTLALDPDGKIVVAGLSFQGGLFEFGNYDFAVARLTRDGFLDSSFDDDGRILDGFGDFEVPSSVLFDAQGRLIVVGTSFGDTGTDFALIAIARYLPNGKRDPTFDNANGHVRRSFAGAHYNAASGAALDAQGRLIVVGLVSPGHPNLSTDPSLHNSNLVVGRFDISGPSTHCNLDTSFGTAGTGVTITDFAGFDDFYTGVEIDPHGRIIAGGWVGATVNRTDFVVTRYNSNGVPDPSFGNGGFVTTSFDVDGQPSAGSLAFGVAFDPIHDIILGGITQAPTGEFRQAIARFDVRRDFALSISAPLSVSVGQSATTAVTLLAIEDYNVDVPVTLVGNANGGPLPTGITASFSGVTGPTVHLQPPPFGSITTDLTLQVARTVTPRTLTLFLRPDQLQDPLHTHQIPVPVTIKATAANIAATVDTLRAADAITNDATATFLKSQLTAAQTSADAGDVDAATKTLRGFLIMTELQRGRNIKTSAVIDGETVNPLAILLTDGRAALTDLQAGTPQHPIVGYVTNGGNQGVGTVTISLFDAANTLVARVATDATGYYAFTATTGLTPGATYTASVTGKPFFYQSATPASQTITWAATGVVLADFQLQ